jgi:hypothetical protein
MQACSYFKIDIKNAKKLRAKMIQLILCNFTTFTLSPILAFLSMIALLM